LATALYILRQGSGASVEERAREVNQLKPHVEVSDAIEAVRFVDQLAIDARAFH
jgi:hypothetical protein